MPCFSPLEAWVSRKRSAKGKSTITFKKSEAYTDLRRKINCGQCLGCRLDYSRQWAVRCVHEASLYEKNCFITLTYAPEHLPGDKSLQVVHWQKFMKRLRKKFGAGIRFFHCGEYGEENGRPHYHALLFNFDFDDKVLLKQTKGGQLFRSKELERLWPYGHSSIGSVTFQSAAYVARYCVKKVNSGKKREFVDKETGEVFTVRNEYVTMSRRGGIGRGFYEKYRGDIFPHDYVVVGGKKYKTPKYYDKIFEHEYPEDHKLIKEKRIARVFEHKDDLSVERLWVREQVQKLKARKLIRSFENASSGLYDLRCEGRVLFQSYGGAKPGRNDSGVVCGSGPPRIKLGEAYKRFLPS